jgi:hypothetical protein
MPKGVPITELEEAKIKAALRKNAHASAVARASKGKWSFSTVQHVADRSDIARTAGRKTMGRDRLTAEQRPAVIELDRAKPKATQAELRGQSG